MHSSDCNAAIQSSTTFSTQAFNISKNLINSARKVV